MMDYDTDEKLWEALERMDSDDTVQLTPWELEFSENLLQNRPPLTDGRRKIIRNMIKERMR